MAGTFKVEITEPAEKDLENILEYIVSEHSYERAQKVLQKILDAIYRLEKMPMAKGLVREVVGLGQNEYRQIVAAKHRIMFTIEEPKKKVFVVRILHVKRGPDFVKDALL